MASGVGGDSLARVLAAARRPHLVGVGGTGMSSLATLLLEMSKSVSGSDSGSQTTLDWLEQRGIRIYRRHAAEQVDDADLVICSAAIPPENPELATARRRGLPIVTHAQALGALMASKHGVAVAGTHGKSTTTALIAHILSAAGRDPTLGGGAEALNFAASSRLGRGPELVAEADEYGRRFLELRPGIAVITSIERDHLDYYRDLDEIVAAFHEFVTRMPIDGLVVSCTDDAVLDRLHLPRRRVRYGFSRQADWRLRSYELTSAGGCRFLVNSPSGDERACELRLPGRHNAENALAALVVADAVGVEARLADEALATFAGTRRRLETKAQASGVWVIDDYAHHPSEIRATLEVARELHQGPIWAVFQPHTAHRTAVLLDEFATAFDQADHVVLTPVYQPAGRDTATAQATSADLAARMVHPDVRVVSSLDEALVALSPALREGSLILTLGAGDIAVLANWLAERAMANAESEPSRG